MQYRAPTQFSRFSPQKLFCVAVVLWLSFVAVDSINSRSASAQTTGDLRFELPANGNLRVENLRGGVIAEVWKENYVWVSAVGSEQSAKLPAIVDRGEGLLSVRLVRGPAAAPRIS